MKYSIFCSYDSLLHIMITTFIGSGTTSNTALSFVSLGRKLNNQVQNNNCACMDSVYLIGGQGIPGHCPDRLNIAPYKMAVQIKQTRYKQLETACHALAHTVLHSHLWMCTNPVIPLPNWPGTRLVVYVHVCSVSLHKPLS